MLRFLLAASKFLSAQTSAFVIVVAIFAFFVPAGFSWVRGTPQTAILGVIMLAMGVTLSREDYKILAKRPLDVFIGACAQYTLMPLIAWTLTKVLGLNSGIAVGLILVGCCPGGVSSNIMSFLCRGDVAFSVGMTTASTLLSPILTPLLVLWLAGETIDVNAWGMFKSILLVTIVPVAIGSFANILWGKNPDFQTGCKLMPGVAVLGLAAIVGGVISAQGMNFFSSGIMIFIGVFLHNTLGYITGYLVGKFTGMSQAQRRTISIEIGMQNAGLATVLATKHFAAMPEAAIASAVSCVWHSISGALLAGIFIKVDKLFAKQHKATDDRDEKQSDGYIVNK